MINCTLNIRSFDLKALAPSRLNMSLIHEGGRGSRKNHLVTFEECHNELRGEGVKVNVTKYEGFFMVSLTLVKKF